MGNVPARQRDQVGGSKSQQHESNLHIKYADDIHLIVPASQSHTIQNELHAIESWSLDTVTTSR